MIASIYSVTRTPLRMRNVTRGGNFYVAGGTVAWGRSQWPWMVHGVSLGTLRRELMIMGRLPADWTVRLTPSPAQNIIEVNSGVLR